MKLGLAQRLALTTVLAGLIAPLAVAQTAGNPFVRNRFVAVQDRPQPAFDPVSRRVGAFLLDTSLGLGASYNDNIFGAETGAVEDTLLTATPRAGLRSTWSSHYLEFGAGAERREYTEQGDESTTDADGYISGRLDVLRDFSIGGTLNAAKVTEQRYAPSSVTGAAEPTNFDRAGGQLNANYRRDRILLRVNFGMNDFDYNDVDAVAGAPAPVIDQDFRDFSESSVGGRVSYAWSPDVAFFVQGSLAESDYDDAAGLVSRDGTRTTAQVGADFELSAPFRGDIAVGTFEDDRDSDLLPDVEGLSVNGRLLWFPTQLTTFTLTGSRGTFDPGLAQSATATSTSFGVRADHELRRNILVFGDVRTSTQEFESIDREDEILDLGLGLGFRINRNLRLDIGYALRSQSSSGLSADRDIDQNILSAGLRIFP